MSRRKELGEDLGRVGGDQGEEMVSARATVCWEVSEL